MSATSAQHALIWFGDPHGGCLSCNETWLTWCKVSTESTVGSGWLDSVHPDDRDRCEGIVGRHSSMHTPFEMELRLRRGDGEYRPMLAVGAPRVDHAGAYCGLTCCLIDITEHLDQRRTRPEFQELMHAALAATHEAELVGTANGASVHRVASLISAERTGAADRDDRPIAGLRTVEGLCMEESPTHRRTASKTPTLMLACSIKDPPPPTTPWAIAELHRAIARRIISTVRADDLIIDRPPAAFVVALIGIADDANADAVIDLLADVITRPLQIGGSKVIPEVQLARITRSPDETFAEAVARAEGALHDSGAPRHHAAA